MYCLLYYIAYKPHLPHIIIDDKRHLFVIKPIKNILGTNDGVFSSQYLMKLHIGSVLLKLKQKNSVRTIYI